MKSGVPNILVSQARFCNLAHRFRCRHGSIDDKHTEEGCCSTEILFASLSNYWLI